MKYRVWAQCISDVYVDIEADNEDQAYEYAKYELDGADFHEDPCGGAWEMGSVDELDDDAEVDFDATEDEDEF